MIDLLCLLEFYNTYEHDNIYFETSKKMLTNFEAIGQLSVQDLAEHLYISSSTLYRFIKMMAYESHNQMRTSQQMFLERYMYNGRYIPKVENSNQTLQEYGMYVTQRINALMNAVDEEQMERMVQLILEARHIIFVGIPMPSAVWRLQIELILLGKETSAFLNPQHQIEAVQNAGEDTLVVMIQHMPENAAFYYDVAKELKEKGIKTAAISNIPVSPTLQYIDEPILFEGDMTESDMLLIEVLLNSIGSKLNQAVIETKRHKNRI